MKIRYVFLTGEQVEIEVSEAIGEIAAAIDEDTGKSNRRETRRHVSLEELQAKHFQPADPGPAVEAAVEELAGKEALYRALEQLPPRQRELLIKVFYADMSIAQIARAEGVDESAVRGRLKRIYKKMKKLLS